MQIEMSFDRILGIIGVLGILIGVGVAIAMDPKSRGEMNFSVGCFVFSGIALSLTIGIWAFKTDLLHAARILISAFLFAGVTVAMVEASRWANGRFEKANRTEARKETAEELPTKREPLTLKYLFDHDFGPDVSRSRWDDRTLTVESKRAPFSQFVINFTPQLCTDMRAGTRFLMLYVPQQMRTFDAEPNRTRKFYVLVAYKFPEIMKQFDTLIEIQPNEHGSTVKSTDLSLSRRLYIYHEDPISPQDLGYIVEEYEKRQLLVEFRGYEYVRDRELQRAIGKH